MAISLSAILLLAIVLVILNRSSRLRVGPAIAAILFGFFLASTGMAPAINRFLNAVADTVGQINL
ncbi:hypothetical protein ACIOEZ_32530 [Streptomyces sp. NPDC087866]|uniref:hypothetical protein n=1 Tax=Streptomyces sp. NPDC087866 TaxID=3365815 RepID=UPI00381570B1